MGLATRTLIFNLVLMVIMLTVLTWIYEGNRNLRYVQRIYVPVEEQYQIVAFGDSIVEGLGASYGNDFVSLLEERTGIPILNLGKRRETTRTAMSRAEEVITFRPEIVILLVGGNDVLYNFSIEERLDNLTRIVSVFQEEDIHVIYAGTRTGVLNDPYQEQLTQRMNELGIVFIPNILDDILYNPRNLFDPLHPNDRGHMLIADRIEPYLIELIERTS